MKKFFGILAMIVCFATLLPGAAGAADEIRTERDAQGVWFITGPEDAAIYDIFEAVGYAVSTDRLWQMELYRRQARGKLSEIFGPGVDNGFLETDIFMRTIGYSDAELQAGYEALDAESRAVISGYVAGVNRRIAEITDPSTFYASVPFEFLALQTLPASWSNQDVLAWTATMQRFFDPEALDTAQLENAELFMTLQARFGPADAAKMFNDLRWTNDPAAPTYIDYTPASDMEATVQPVNEMQTEIALNSGKAAMKLIKNREKMIDSLKRINAHIKMGSYAWVVSGAHTDTGDPILYSGPQMGFSVPSIVAEGSIRAGGLDVSGMTVPGLPGIVIGRTPHHAWSMQVGHAHTTDYYFETPADVALHRYETIPVRGMAAITIPVFRSDHGPIVNPLPYDPDTPETPLVAWKYAHWGYEFDSLGAFLKLSRAGGISEFGQGMRRVAVSQHFCYADRDGNIAYWMSGREPVRPPGEWRLPQGVFGFQLEWDSANVMPLSHDVNNPRGWYAGWNNKSSAVYPSGFNTSGDVYGPFHRTHVIYDFFDTAIADGGTVRFEDVRDLALDIATTDSFGGGGNPWKFVADPFTLALRKAGLTPANQEYLKMLKKWDGHFVAGGSEKWVSGTDRADAWVLMDRWIEKALEFTFLDELGEVGNDGTLVLKERRLVLFNTFLHGLKDTGITNGYDWFANRTDPQAPQTPDAIILSALQSAMAELGPRPWGIGARGQIVYNHDILGAVHAMPFASRSTYAHCVAYGTSGPVRIESMFPLGESGCILYGAPTPACDVNFFSMTPYFDNFIYRDFPLFD